MKKFVLLSVMALIFSFVVESAYSQEYCLGPDDVLKITVYREPELDRKVRVSIDGNIVFPLLGKVYVEGSTVSEFEEVLTEKLKKYIKHPQVTVFLDEYATITVTGQVESPGSYSLKSRLTIIEAIGLAGGFTKIAAKNKVRVMRVNENGEEDAFFVRVASITNKGDKSQDVVLKRGDVVYVPESLF